MFKTQIHRDRSSRARRPRAMASLLAAAALALGVSDRQVAAREIKGTVAAVNGKTAKINTKAAGSAKVGDRVEIFEILPEIQDVASVATGRVSQLSAGAVWATIERATGTVTAGQRARIFSAASPPGTAPPKNASSPADRGTRKHRCRRESDHQRHLRRVDDPPSHKSGRAPCPLPTLAAKVS